jgi:flagellar biosynthesis protein FlhA
MSGQMTTIGPSAGSRRSEASLAIGVVGVLVVMMLPLPAIVMDLLLAANLAFSLLMLCVALYLRRPLDFGVFPSLLLLATLSRLALNVATTRLILLHGHEGTQAAGQMIETFGQFVVGGNFVVGGIVFLILVLINFIVITKGSERVAEVSARFTLDAMPGKQMAIDSEMAAGAIGEDEARRRRHEIELEADFYGAMDGSSKFVRGDAIAGLIITGINIVGGLVIGTMQQGMQIGDAAVTYSLLTIGDGLISQIPALMISTSAGMVMTRAATDDALYVDIGKQFSRYGNALRIVSGVLFLFAWLPGVPSLVLFGLSGALWLLARKNSSDQQQEADPVVQAQESPTETAETLRSMLPVDDMELELGYSLVKLLDGKGDGDLLHRIKAIRRQVALEQGFIVPPVHIRDNLRSEPDVYRILIRGVEVGRGQLLVDRIMAMDPGGVSEQIEGIPGKEPAFGMDALFILPADRERAEMAGYTVVDCSTVIATHLTEIIRRHAADLLGRQESQELIEVVAQRSPKLVEDLIPATLTLGEVVRVLKLLLEEQVSIRDMAAILETLGDKAPATRDPYALAEAVRSRTAAGICQRLEDPDGRLHAVFLDSQTELLMRDRVIQTDHGPALAIDVGQARHLIKQLQGHVAASLHNPVLVVSADLRRAVGDLLRRFLPQMAVLAHSEVQPRGEAKNIGVLSLAEPIVERTKSLHMPEAVKAFGS